MATIKTSWELATYDVLGNSNDGYDVNDVYRHNEPIELSIPVTVHNPGTDFEFKSASPTSKQIRKAFGIRCQIETDGNAETIYISRARDLYPIGELHCTSHESLSPVREFGLTS